MSSTNDIRGMMRRLALIHILWVPFIVIAVYLLGGHPSWHRSWVLLLGLVPTLLATPNYIKFRRLAIQNGYRGRVTYYMYFVQGISVRVLEGIIKAREAQEALWAHLCRIVTDEQPQLLQSINRLRQRDKYDEAVQLLLRTRRDQERAEQARQLKLGQLADKGHANHCTHLVGPLLVAGRLDEAESVVDRCFSLLVQAHKLDAADEVISAIKAMSPGDDFFSVEEVLDEARDRREMNRLKAALVSRINEAPSREQSRLFQLVDELVQLAFGSRDFRKKHHELEVALGQALGNT